jgi:NDP-hexose 4-ketoreductase
MEIIGAGMIANGMRPHAEAVGDAVVFAAGVSDSTLTDQREYDRECRMLGGVLRDCRLKGRTLVYFSSGGTVYGRRDDERREDTPPMPETVYGRHKVFCESVIVYSGVKYLIARLPPVVGQTRSQKQLIPVLARQAIEGHVTLMADAERDIIGIADAARIVTAVLKKLELPQIMNIASGVSIPVTDIFEEIRRSLGVTPEVKTVAGGDKQRFNIDKLRAFCPDAVFPPDYYKGVIRSYISEFWRT